MSVPLAQIPTPHDTTAMTLVEQLVQWARRRIEERVFRPGMRMPSIRKLALDKPIRELVRIAPPGGLVLDPFAGSGSCGEAATIEGRRWAGCELSAHYAQVARDRVATAGTPTAPPRENT